MKHVLTNFRDKYNTYVFVDLCYVYVYVIANKKC